jgi:hypothetical protein
MVGTLTHGLLAALILAGLVLSDPGAADDGNAASSDTDSGNPPAPASPKDHESAPDVEPGEAVAGAVDDEEEIADPDRYRKGPGW